MSVRTGNNMRPTRRWRAARAGALAMAAALLVLGTDARAGSIGKTSFPKGGATRVGSSSFSSGTRSTPRSKFGRTNGSRGQSAFSRSTSSAPRGKFPTERGSSSESAFAAGLRTTARNTKFPDGDGGSDLEFSRDARSTPGRKFPDGAQRAGEGAFSDASGTTPTDDFKAENGRDQEFSDNAATTARRKFPDGDLEQADPAFSDDLMASVQSRFPVSDGAKASGGGVERLRSGPRDFSRQRAAARPRAATGSRAIIVGPSPRARGGARDRSVSEAPAPPSADERGMQRLPLPPRGGIPIVIDGQTYYRHGRVVIRAVQEGEPVPELVDNRGD